MNNGQNEWISKAEDIADRVSSSSVNSINRRNSIAIENRSKESISRLNITIYIKLKTLESFNDIPVIISS